MEKKRIRGNSPNEKRKNEKYRELKREQKTPEAQLTSEVPKEKGVSSVEESVRPVRPVRPVTVKLHEQKQV